MAELIARQSALAALGLDGRARDQRGNAGVALAEKAFPNIVDLRGDAGNAEFLGTVQGTLGLELPLEPNSVKAKAGTTVFWIGPDQWWVLEEAPADTAAQLRDALGQVHAAVTEVGESRACIAVAGPKARDLLAKACPLDLHPRVFETGRCAQSLLAKTHGLIHQTSEEPAYELYVLRSYAEYLWHWLEDAGREYGVAVVRQG